MNKNFKLPTFSENLSSEHLDFLQTFSTACRRSILEMVRNAQSGHPGGSLSSIDFFTLLYAFIIGQTGEKIVISNGHISPAAYSVLIEMGYANKQEVLETFRQIGSVFEGHVTRHVPGIYYGTGPLGIGVSAASGFAYSEKLKALGENLSDTKKVFAVMGDGEAQEGQVHEMMHFAAKYKLDNYCVFVDYNDVQATDSLEKVMPIDISALFKAGGWAVVEIDGHDFKSMWKALSNFYNGKYEGKPVLIAAKTVMGKGVEFMEADGLAKIPSWHGKAPSADMVEEVLNGQLALSEEEINGLEFFRQNFVEWNPIPNEFTKTLTLMPEIKTGEAKIYESGTVTDCRSAYGDALLDLAKLNENILALSADLSDSTKTGAVGKEFPERHIEVGISEQSMFSVAGGLSLDGWIPFASTFGAFTSSRAKDQVRVNDINNTNVKMVSTHCGLSVGEDGPTHQAIDDMTSFLGMFGTHVIEPTDANQCDKITRFIASHFGNFYVRMGRHKFPVLTKEDGTPFYDKDYVFEYGKADIIRHGTELTLVASGACVGQAVEAVELAGLQEKVEVIALSCLKQIDPIILESLKKTRKLLTVEDHNTTSGIGAMLAAECFKNQVNVDVVKMLGVEEYQLSGTQEDLYKAAGIDAEGIANALKNFNL